jgi:hypothetical protein
MLLKKFRFVCLTSVCLFTNLPAIADGLPLVEGRYPGLVLVFKLTADQKDIIEHYRTCQLEHSMDMNVFTPYVFALTRAQAGALKKRVGYVPSRFEVFETVRGYIDAGPFWNLVLRFTENEIEIPLGLLLPDKKAKEAHAVQGWKLENPCFPELKMPK